MTDRRDEESDEEESERPAAPARKNPEGVRILGAEEAQAAMDAGNVGTRLGDTATRYGDVPPRPDPAIRPSVRFPRAADEPVPDVVARPTPDEGGSEEDPATPDQEDLLGSTRARVRETRSRSIAAIDLSAEEGRRRGHRGRRTAAMPDDRRGCVDGAGRLGAGAPSCASPALPHWSEPPTGEMPQLLPEADPVDLTGEESLDAYAAAASTAGGPRFLTGVGDWAQEDLESMDALGDDSTNVGALASAPEDDDTAFDREVAARRKFKPSAEAAAPVGAPARPKRPARPPRPEDELHAPAIEADLTTRIITGVGMAVLALICLKLGRDATTVLATAIVGLASLELFQGLQRRGFRPATILAVLGSLAIVPIAYQRGEFAFPFTIAIVTVFTLLWYMFQVVRARPVVNVAVTVMGFVYVGCLGAFAGLLLSYQNGVGLILGVVLCVVAYDIVGYVVGSQFGKTRVAPMISPNKTVEGLVGGHGGVDRRRARDREPDHPVERAHRRPRARRRRRDRGAARRPLRVDAQAGPRGQGLRDAPAGPRRDPGPLRRHPVLPAGGLLPRPRADDRLMAGPTNVVLLGSTGSIGTQALEVIRDHREDYRVVALAAGTQRRGARRAGRGVRGSGRPGVPRR